ncbi:MAG: hypothetical protein CVU64_23415 [Deltaproteobacteria bacterium HGW-Deltaproteobacteria-21]|jgi:deoxyribose-phosphate aldolase|nr:MAG: hypothetical protein CVU64_23415 [Deltaproteobacteria bacterium HGW-Deltaproteobacteria-21]
MGDHRRIRLFIDPEVRMVLEERRLKEEDLQRTLSEAEQTGKKFVHPHTGHFLAGVRQGSVTVWVEYSRHEDGFKVHRAYQHRVEVTAWDYKTGRTK